MKKYRVVAVHHPILRCFRNTLRQIIAMAVFDQLAALQAIGEGESQESMDLEFNLKSSICECEACGARDRDMIYFPVLQGWYCTACDHKKRIWFPKVSQ